MHDTVKLTGFDVFKIKIEIKSGMHEAWLRKHGKKRIDLHRLYLRFYGGDIELCQFYMVFGITFCNITHTIDLYKIRISFDSSLCLECTF